jgi:hypothetical protein
MKKKKEFGDFDRNKKALKTSQDMRRPAIELLKLKVLNPSVQFDI